MEVRICITSQSHVRCTNSLWKWRLFMHRIWLTSRPTCMGDHQGRPGALALLTSVRSLVSICKRTTSNVAVIVPTRTYNLIYSIQCSFSLSARRASLWETFPTRWRRSRVHAPLPNDCMDRRCYETRRQCMVTFLLCSGAGRTQLLHADRSATCCCIRNCLAIVVGRYCSPFIVCSRKPSLHLTRNQSCERSSIIETECRTIFFEICAFASIEEVHWNHSEICICKSISQIFCSHSCVLDKYKQLCRRTLLIGITSR